MMNRYKKLHARQLIVDLYDRLLQAWNVEVKEMSVETSYGKTHMIIAGKPENPPLLLFHGVADHSAMMWVYNAEKLSESYYLIAIDTIGGSGKSEPNHQYYKNFDQLVWLDELLDSLQIQETYICGVSYGAYLGYTYALVRPDRVLKVVCLAGRIPTSQFEVMAKMMSVFMPEAIFPSEKNCKKLLRKMCGSNYIVFENNDELMKSCFYLLKYFNNKSMMQHKIEIHRDEELAELKDRTLFLIGESDRLTHYPKTIKRLQDNELTYKIIEDAGHALNHERADLINEEIINYLSG